MRPPLRHLTAILLAGAALVAGCGGGDKSKGDPIPQATAAELIKQLDSLQRRFDHGDGACNDISQNLTAIDQQVSGLPSSTDPDVRDALQKSVSHLSDLTADCDTTKGQNTTPTETTPTETTPTETVTIPTETVTIPTPTIPTTPEKPKKGNGNGNGGDQGGASAPGGG